MNTTQPKAGNKFAKKETERKKPYRFQLIEDFSKAKPRDKDTGEMIHNPYPPIYFVENEGVAIDEKGNQRRWRYLHGYPTIWVDEQINPKPEKAQLMNAKNTIMFVQGFLSVNPSDKALMQALKVQDVFEGNKNKVNPRPDIYRLIDEEKEFDNAMLAVDAAYEAEKAVREAKASELLPLAMVFGLNNENGLDDEPRLRKQLILKAKQAPQAVLTNLVDPRNTVKYLVTQGLQSGYLVAESGTLKFAETGVIIKTIDTEKDVAEQVAKLFVGGDEEISKLYQQLQVVMA